MAQYPHIRVFYSSDGLFHFMSFTDGSHNGQYAEKRIGQGLIDFVELDLSKYRLGLAGLCRGYNLRRGNAGKGEDGLK